MKIYTKGNSIKGFLSFVLLFLIFILIVCCSLLVLYKVNLSDSGQVDGVTQTVNSQEIKINSYSNYKQCAVKIYIKSKKSSAYSIASGTIMSEDGYIVSNDHIYEDMRQPELLVQLYNGEYYEAAFVGSDSYTDVSLLKIDATNLIAANFADSNGLSQGDEVFCVGNPMFDSLDFTLTQGIVSAVKRRIITSQGYTCELIQIDNAINSGCSGGPLFDAKGRVVGIVSSKIDDVSVENIGFCIPSNVVIKVIDELKQNGTVTNRGKLGVSFNFIKQSDAKLLNKQSGLCVTKIDVNSELFESGLEIGDIIISINNVKIKDDLLFFDLLDSLQPKDEIELVVRKHDGTDITLKSIAIRGNGINSYYNYE